MPNLYWNNFRMGQRRDAALREDALLSARELTNFDIDYDGESADLVIRPGFTRWNAVELSAPAQQLYPFVDLSQNFNLLGIADSRWRAIKPTGAHVTLVGEAATATRPVTSFGNRAFFGTDTDAYWTDDASIDSGTPSFRMGIVKPPNGPGVMLQQGQGNTGSWLLPTDSQQVASALVGLRLNTSGHQKIAMTYTPIDDLEIANIPLHFRVFFNSETTGSFRAAIYTGAVEPTTLVASSIWLGVTGFVADEDTWDECLLESPITLTAGTKYWIVLETDQEYNDNFLEPTVVGLNNGFYVSFAYTTFAPAGDSLQFGGSTWSNESRDLMAVFLLGGLNPSHFYDYKITYFNETYNSESRPSDTSGRVEPIGSRNMVLVTTTSTLDGQVDFVAIYRRDRGTDPNISEDNITGDFEYVDQVGVGLPYTDTKGEGLLGARLHSEDHYLYDEADDTNQNKRDAFVPAGFVLWKGRIWAWAANSNKLYFTKTFERNNPMGLVGESTPDYFPLDNIQDFPVPSGIINAKALSNDQLAVYFRNEQIWIVSGGDSVLNPPPPHDIAIRPTYQTVGLFAPDAVTPYSDSNIFVGREGVYRFHGIGSRPELLSETQGGILDDIENQYFRNTKLVSYGREIWVLIDSDNDGDLDKILILDLERDFVTRNIVDRAWRGRTYPVAMTDIAVHSTGDEFREILAADAVDGWIMKLNDADTDNGAAIVGTAESHDLRAPHNAMIYQLLMQPFYNDEDNLPDYDLSDQSCRRYFSDLHDRRRGHYRQRGHSRSYNGTSYEASCIGPLEGCYDIHEERRYSWVHVFLRGGMMGKLRRGVQMEQLQDDLERVLGIQDSSDEVPEMERMGDNRFTIINGTGEIVFRSGGKRYKLTATEI